MYCNLFSIRKIQQYTIEKELYYKYDTNIFIQQYFFPIKCQHIKIGFSEFTVPETPLTTN